MFVVAVALLEKLALSTAPEFFWATHCPIRSSSEFARGLPKRRELVGNAPQKIEPSQPKSRTFARNLAGVSNIIYCLLR